MNDSQPTARVAVIGSGLAGLTASHLLAAVPKTILDDDHIEVHLFERTEQLGMDNSSISIETEKGSYRVDVPMRSINGGSHGRVKKLYDYLKVPLVKNEFSYSFSQLSYPSSIPRSRTSPSSSPSRAPATPSTATSSAFDSRASTPLPQYSETPQAPPSLRNRSYEPGTNTRRDQMERGGEARCTRTTTLLYEGSSGLRWPPVSLPSSLLSSSSSSSSPSSSRDAWPSPYSLPALVRSAWMQASHIVHLIFLAISYFHLLFLSFFYVYSGLTQSRSHLTFSLPFLTRSWTVRNVGSERLEKWCERHGIFRDMQDQVLIPLMAAVCTVGMDQAREMPIGEALEYITSTFMSSHYTTVPSFGVRGIVRRLIAPVPVSNVHLSTHITRISFATDGHSRPYNISYRVGQGEKEEEEKELGFDYIIFATQANQAASLLETLTHPPPSNTTHQPLVSRSLKEILSALRSFTYVQALVVNHTDSSFLPLETSDRRDLNLATFDLSKIPGSSDEDSVEGIWTTHLPPTSIETTHLISAHPSLISSSSSASRASTSLSTTAPSTILQTTNPLRPVQESQVLSSSWFWRAFVTKESKRVLPRFLFRDNRDNRSTTSKKTHEGDLQGLSLGSIGGNGAIYFCGSWCERGIPLLEGCVTSAEGVVKEILKREGALTSKQDWPF